MTMKSIMSKVSLGTFLTFPFFVSFTSATCYLPDGSLAPGAYRCNNATSGHSTCCEIGSVCWSNGVCQKQTNGITDWIRLGCTDPTWNDTACLHACMDITHNALGVRPCDGIGGTNYCCDLRVGDPGNMSCCSTSADLFSVPSATVEATVLATPISISTTTVSSTPVSTISSSSTLNSPSSTSTSAAGSSALPAGAQAGIGVGVSLGAIAAAALGFFFWRRRKTNKNYNAATASDPSQQGHYQNGAWNTESKEYKNGHMQMQQGPPWSPMTPATQAPTELDNTEPRAPAELSSSGHDYQELDTQSDYR